MRKASIVIIFLVTLLGCGSKQTKGLYYYRTLSDNMIPNIRQYDVIGLDTSTKHLDYGDIVRAVYHTTEGDDTELFRIVGLPGDTVAVKDNISAINGQQVETKVVGIISEDIFEFEKLVEILPNKRQNNIYRGTMKVSRDNMGSYLVPDSCYFLLGDSRSLSIDSRFIGFVPLKDIKGKVVEVNGVRIE